MKESIKWILGALALVVLVAGAYLLYDKLAPEFAPDQLTEVPPASGLDNAPVPDAPPSPDGDTPVKPGTPDTPSDEPPSDDAPPAGEHTTVNRVPDFTVLDGEGNERKLSEFFGKPIVINFWATWCGYCLQEMPDFDQAAKDHPEVIFMMVNVTDGKRETMEKAKAFIAEQGFTFPVYYDTTLQATMTYGASGLPRTFFIGADGSHVAHANGMISAATLEFGISKITE
jgi:thiol-disulfide isomerase/thioredoxin